MHYLFQLVGFQLSLRQLTGYSSEYISSLWGGAKRPLLRDYIIIIWSPLTVFLSFCIFFFNSLMKFILGLKFFYDKRQAEDMGQRLFWEGFLGWCSVTCLLHSFPYTFWTPSRDHDQCSQVSEKYWGWFSLVLSDSECLLPRNKFKT